MILEGKELKVFKGVYPPSEDTFLLIDAIREAPAGKALELCCGTGAVGLSAAEGVEEITTIDINPLAAMNTLKNYADNGLDGKLNVIAGDLFSPLRRREFDLVFMNPPYLPDEAGMPQDLAWSGMEKGRSVIDRFIYGIGSYLGHDGRAFFVQSTVNGIDESIDLLGEQGMTGRVVREEKLQFERLVVIEVRHAHHARAGGSAPQKD